MGAIDKDIHRPWLAYALEESLEHSLLTPKDVVDHANPEVLVTQLPPPVISVLLSRALTIGTFSAAQVLESVPPALLAEHLDPEVMWRCLKDAAERGGLSRVGGARTSRSRQWFASVLGRALESAMVTPADVLRFLPPSEFVTAAPRSVMVDLVKEALARSSFDAELVLQHITPTVIAENLETSLVWQCIAEAAGRHFDLTPTTAVAKPTGPTFKASPVQASTTVAGSALTAAASAKTPTKASEKASEKERPVVERPAPGPTDDRTPPPAFIGASPSGPKSSSGGPGSVRGEIVAARTPAPSVASSVPVVANGPQDTSDWTPAGDDRRFPFPPNR